MAIGRTPEVSSLNLDQIGIKFDKSKKIITNQHYQTDVENIFAIGDIRSGGLELTPVAIKEGEYLVEGIVNNKW
jgi:pyruvate/2-oxoglutarate dehydrogenase complex dihydrolipoamide dehydrogenase (E3) component